MLKLKLQYSGHLIRRTDSLEKTLMLGKIEGRRRWGWQRMRRLDGITDSMDMSLSKLQSWWWTGKPGMLESMGSQRVGHDWATELNWKIVSIEYSGIFCEQHHDSLVLGKGLAPVFCQRFLPQCSLLQCRACLQSLVCAGRDAVSGAYHPRGL